MNRSFRTLALVASASALQLESDLEKTWTLNDSPWNPNGDFVDAAIKAGTPFDDVDFPAESESLGGVTGDSANQSLQGDQVEGVEWKRVSEIFDADKLKMFSNQAPYSTMTQGALGSCYLLAAFVGLDARPGALEKIFYTKTINSAGIYAMNLYMNGRPIVAHVDDKIPVKEGTRFGRKGFFPPYASSSVEGEIWPMIGEKIWAKLTGSYANAESGSASWVLNHVTNDFAFQFGPNEDPEKSWKKVKEWSRREYLQFIGTHATSYVGGGHAYTILKASDINIDGTTKRILKLRNPWGSTMWTGAHAAGTPEYKALAAHFETEGISNEDEGGKFFITWEDMMKESGSIDVALGAESRISGIDHPEWQPRVDLDSSQEKHTLTLDICNDINLAEDVLAIQLWQGGNKLGTQKNDSVAKTQSNFFDWKIKNEDGSFEETHQDQGAGGIWDMTSGKYWDSSNSNYSKIPKGRYTLEQTMTGWNVNNDLLKEMTFGVSSPEPVVLNVLTQEQIDSARGAKLVGKHATCEKDQGWLRYSDDFADSLAKAKALDNCTHFMYGDGQPGMPAKCCDGTATSTSHDYAPYYNVFEIAEGDATLTPKSYDDNCGTPPQPDVEADPGASPPPAAEQVDPTEPVTPVEPVAPFVDTDCTPKESVGSCEVCQSSDQCADNAFCCPFMKKCVATSSTPCYYPIATCYGCWDSVDPNDCNCTNEDFPAKWGHPTCAKGQDPLPTCTGTMIHHATTGECVCPVGTHSEKAICVVNTCPDDTMTLSKASGECECPAGTNEVSGLCVAPESQPEPTVEPTPAVPVAKTFDEQAFESIMDDKMLDRQEGSWIDWGIWQYRMVPKVGVKIGAKKKYYFVEELRNTRDTTAYIKQKWASNMRLANHDAFNGQAKYAVSPKESVTWMAQYLEGRDQPFAWSMYEMTWE